MTLQAFCLVCFFHHNWKANLTNILGFVYDENGSKNFPPRDAKYKDFRPILLCDKKIAVV